MNTRFWFRISIVLHEKDGGKKDWGEQQEFCPGENYYTERYTGNDQVYIAIISCSKQKEEG